MPVATARILGSKMMSSGGKSVPGGQTVHPPGDLHLPLERIGLTTLDEKHQHGGASHRADGAQVGEESLLAFLERDRIDDVFSLYGFPWLP